MTGLSDEDLLGELAGRIDEKNRALFELRMATRRLEEVNRRLVESEALKGHFLANIRNEVNNPLAAILALAGEIASGLAQDPAERSLLARTIQEEAFNLDFQLRNIFCAAEIEAGDALPVLAAVDLRALLETTLAPFVSLAAKQGQRLDTLWEVEPAAGATFTTDPAKLQVILANLVSNAVKYGGTGAVRVRVRQIPGELSLCVEDDGPGIDPADHETIFERFRRLEAGRLAGCAGHGLGLSIVRALLELLGGSISVDSALGRGSRFAVVIPELDNAGSEHVFADAGNEYFFDA